jgi:hypothetical protein
MAKTLSMYSAVVSDVFNVRESSNMLVPSHSAVDIRASINCQVAVLHLDMLTLVGGFIHTIIERPLYRNAQLQLCVDLLCIGDQTIAIGIKSDCTTVSATVVQRIIVYVVVQRFTKQADSIATPRNRLELHLRSRSGVKRRIDLIGIG